jgi:hypothetical protein
MMAVEFGPNITIDGQTAGQLRRLFERQVHGELLSIMMFRTGRAVIAAIEATRRHLRIVPRNLPDQNADESPFDWEAATLRGIENRDGSGNYHSVWGQGTGRGSSVRIRYNPWDWSVETLPCWDPVAMHNWRETLGLVPVDAGAETEEVLLHEMVHAMESMTGRADHRRMVHGFDTVAEFNAILVVNLHSAEQSRGSRLNHSGHATAGGQQTIIPDNAEFWRRVRNFVSRHRGLAKDLAAVPIPDNPFRDPRSVFAPAAP